VPSSQGLPDLVAELSRQIEAQTHTLRTLAREGPVGGSPGWHSFVADLPVLRLSEAQQREYLTHGAPIKTGALPIDVRGVLEHWCQEFKQKAWQLQHRFNRESDHSPVLRAAEEALARIDRWLGTYVEREVKAHLNAVRPALGRSSIFQNALRSTPRWGSVSSAVNTLSCKACGAPRSDESAQTCGFCGSSLFTDP
jgi:hypothetical protein